MKKITIAIDGYSSTGKSTVARQLASHFGYIYIDTGAMYRAVTYYALKQNVISENHFDKSGIIEILPEIDLEFRKVNSEDVRIFLNGENVENEIRNLMVSQFVSRVAAIREVRLKLVAQQRKMGKEKGVVMDGRDIGTVVFPNAELKIFMTASPEIRAKRRYEELLSKGENVDFEQIIENIKTRDYLDTTREDSPLRMAADAIEFDNSNINPENQFLQLVKMVENKINEVSKN